MSIIKNTSPICYMCDNKAISKEHVPPKCIFPESKDIHGIDFRSDLITVPSCDIHNLQKSKDDEYLMIILSNIKGNNQFGRLNWQTKIKRALNRKGENFFDREILKNPRIVKEIVNGEDIYIKYGDPDFQRLIKCFEHISYGLYYAENKTKFLGNIYCALGFIKYNNPNTQQKIEMALHIAKTDKSKLGQEFKGANPEVFQYQFHREDEYGICGLYMIFFESVEIFTAFTPLNFKLEKTFIPLLIENGNRVIINQSGKSFDFNKKES